jgi:hypothetical protein
MIYTILRFGTYISEPSEKDGQTVDDRARFARRRRSQDHPDIQANYGMTIISNTTFNGKGKRSCAFKNSGARNRREGFPKTSA